MYIYNKNLITKIKNYLNEDYRDAVFSTKIKYFTIDYQYRFSIHKKIPYQKTSHPKFVLIIKLKFLNIKISDEEFKLYDDKGYLLGKRKNRRFYFKDIMRNTILSQIKSMFGDELETKVSFENEKIFDLLKK